MTNAAVYFSDGRVDVTKLVVGPLDNNVYIVTCKESGESALIDAANESGRLIDIAQLLNVKQVLTTHGHGDHIGAVAEMRDAGYPVGVNEHDASTLPGYDFLLQDDAIIVVGKQRIRCIFTPGHTLGSMCFAVENTPLLFTGDTLFPGGPGATKGPGADFITILQSIEERLFKVYDDETLVVPGHGDDTTLGAERPHRQEWAKRGW